MADIERLRKNLEAHGFQTSWHKDRTAAADYLCAALHGTTIGFGGSVTTAELGLFQRLGADNQVFWHWKQERGAALEQAARAQVYICSANGVAETGEIVNIDGAGNRLASTMFGPEKVYIIIGLNKITPDLDSAIHRARNVASPLNARRLKRNTPCAVSEELRCFDCSSPERICGGLLVLWRKMGGVRECEVVIVGEELGF